MAFVLAGEIMGQRAGVVNIGVEGQMLIGAAGGFGATVLTGNPWLGLLAGALFGAALSSVHGLLCLVCKANQITSGVAVLVLGSGLSSYFGTAYVGKEIDGFAPFTFDFLPRELSEVIRQITPTMLLGLIVPLAAGVFLFRTRPGLCWRAVGESPAVASSLGLSTLRYRWMAILLGGFLSGLGGAAFSVDYTKGWSDGMTNGRGLVALGLVVMARWNPYWTTPVAMIFGAAESLSLTVQLNGMGTSSYLLATLPYLVPLVFLVIDSSIGRSLNRMPASLNDVFIPNSTK
jgi:simple sugar transport system permease protein